MSIPLSATKRQIGNNVIYQGRAAGLVPAVVYGSGIEPKNVFVEIRNFVSVFKEAGESTLVDLNIEGEPMVKVLIQDLQRDPLSSEIIHADFRAVDLTKEITAEIKLRFVGEAAAVKELDRKSVV